MFFFLEPSKFLNVWPNFQTELIKYIYPACFPGMDMLYFNRKKVFNIAEVKVIPEIACFVHSKTSSGMFWDNCPTKAKYISQSSDSYTQIKGIR